MFGKRWRNCACVGHSDRFRPAEIQPGRFPDRMPRRIAPAVCRCERSDTGTEGGGRQKAERMRRRRRSPEPESGRRARQGSVSHRGLIRMQPAFTDISHRRPEASVPLRGNIMLPFIMERILHPREQRDKSCGAQPTSPAACRSGADWPASDLDATGSGRPIRTPDLRSGQKAHPRLRTGDLRRRGQARLRNPEQDETPHQKTGHGDDPKNKRPTLRKHDHTMMHSESAERDDPAIRIVIMGATSGDRKSVV